MLFWRPGTSNRLDKLISKTRNLFSRLIHKRVSPRGKVRISLEPVTVEPLTVEPGPLRPVSIEPEIHEAGFLESEILEPKIANTDMDQSQGTLQLPSTVIDTDGGADASESKHEATTFPLMALPTEVIKLVMNHVQYWEDFVTLTEMISFSEDPLTERQNAAVNTFKFHWPRSYLVMVGPKLRKWAEKTEANRIALQNALCEGADDLLRLAMEHTPLLTRSVWEFHDIVHKTLLPLEKHLRKADILPPGISPYSDLPFEITDSLHKPVYDDLLTALLIFWLYCDFFVRSIMPQELPKGCFHHEKAYSLGTQLGFLSANQDAQQDLQNLGRSYLWVERMKDVFGGKFALECERRRTAKLLLCNNGLDTFRLFASDTDFGQPGHCDIRPVLPPREQQVLVTQLEAAKTLEYGPPLVPDFDDPKSGLCMALSWEYMDDYQRMKEERERARQEEIMRQEEKARQEARKRRKARERLWLIEWERQGEMGRQRKLEWERHRRLERASQEGFGTERDAQIERESSNVWPPPDGIYASRDNTL